MTDVVATHCRERQQPAHHGFGNNSMTNADTLNGEFITYAPRDPTLWGDAGGSANPKTLVNRTGTVNMDKYIAWLKDPAHGYAFAN